MLPYDDEVAWFMRDEGRLGTEIWVGGRHGGAGFDVLGVEWEDLHPAVVYSGMYAKVEMKQLGIRQGDFGRWQ